MLIVTCRKGKFLAYCPEEIQLFNDSLLLHNYSKDTLIKTITLEDFFSIRTFNVLLNYEFFNRDCHSLPEIVFATVVLRLRNPEQYLLRVLENISLSDTDIRKFFLFLINCIPDTNFCPSLKAQLHKELEHEDISDFTLNNISHVSSVSPARFCKMFGKYKK